VVICLKDAETLLMGSIVRVVGSNFDLLTLAACGGCNFSLMALSSIESASFLAGRRGIK
jgi:hypothetical protein